MEKSLEYARTIYLVLITLSAAIMLFAIAAQVPNDPAPALASLKLLNEARLEPLTNEIEQQIKKEWNGRGFQTYLQRLKDETQLPITEANFNWESLGIYEEISLKNATLTEIQKYLEVDHPVQMVLTNFDQMFAKLRASLPFYSDVLRENADSYKLEFVKAVNRPEEGWKLHLTWLDPDPKQRAFNIGRFEQLPTPPVSEVPLAGLSVNKFIFSQHITPDMFRSLAPFWSEINSDNIETALLKLQRLEAQHEKQFELFNLKIPSRLAALISALLSLVILLYMLAHLSHLRRQAISYKEEMLKFPWIVFFPDYLSAALAYSSLSVLPVASNMLLLLRSFNPKDVNTWITFAAFVVLIITSVAVFRVIRSLRSSLIGLTS